MILAILHLTLSLMLKLIIYRFKINPHIRIKKIRIRIQKIWESKKNVYHLKLIYLKMKQIANIRQFNLHFQLKNYFKIHKKK